MKAINRKSKIKILWKIWRGANKISEDFNSLNTNLKVFLVGGCDTYAMGHVINREVEPGYDVIEIDVYPNMLAEGAYNLKALWTKNQGRDVLTSMRADVFGITDNEEEASVRDEEVRLVSMVESIGRDGMSAYETAVLRGLEVGTEKEWVTRENEFVHNESAREAAEAKRAEVFAQGEQSRAEVFAQSEAQRAESFDANEAEREAEFDSAIQAARDNLVVVNDLTTGGADKALSAEMGKVIGHEIDKVQSEIGRAFTFSITYEAAYQNKKIPRTIFKGERILLPAGIQLTGRTGYDDSEYFVIGNGTVVDRDINWLKSVNYTGEMIIGVEPVRRAPFSAKIEYTSIYPSRKNDTLQDSSYFEGYVVNLTGLYELGVRFIRFMASTNRIDMENDQGAVIPAIIYREDDIELEVLTNSIYNLTQEKAADNLTAWWYRAPITQDSTKIKVSYGVSESNGKTGHIFTPNNVFFELYNPLDNKINEIDANLNDTTELVGKLRDKVYELTDITQEIILNYDTEFQNQLLPFTIQKGSIIRLSRDVKVTCRTYESDDNYQTVENGTIADIDINYVKSSTFTGELTITALSKGTISNLSDEIDNLKESILDKTLEATLNYTSEYQNKPLPFTIKQGSIIHLSSDVTVTCRTNERDSTYQIVTDGTIADIDINYVKSSTFTGDLTITAILKGTIGNLSDEINGLKESVTEYDNNIMTAKEGSGIAYREMSRCGLRPIKILGVGNSWTGNATLYLGNILNSLGLSADINTSYAGSATLEMYNNNINNPTPIFTHRKWNKNTGSWDESDVSPYEDIFMSEDWDIVTHQQQSARAGKYDTFQPYLNNIINWEKKVSRVTPLIAMHATWAYPNGYDNAMFDEYYGGDTTTMYNSLLSAYDQAMIDEKIGLVFPSAPMIQQVRTLGIESIDTPDGGSHLSTNGCFAASCVWAEMLLRYYYYDSVSNGKRVTDSSYKPASLSDEQAAQIRALAVEIVNNVLSYFPVKNRL